MWRLLTQHHGRMIALLLFFMGLLRTEKCMAIAPSSRKPHLESTRPNPLHQSEQEAISYFVFPPSKSSSRNDWKSMCPPLWSPQDTKDVTLLWSCCDDTQEVATALLYQLSPSKINSAMVETVTESLETLRDFCAEKLLSKDGHGMKFKVRLVATRGPSGTKCPQWHIDHLPVRWIQSLVGPGCEMIVGNTKEGINWSLVNGFDENVEDTVQMSVQERNRALVKESVAECYTAKEMEAIILVGNRWGAFSKEESHIPPVVHRSPTLLLGQARVLLTQDIILEDVTK